MLTTGSKGLDTVLQGGLKPASIVLLEGLPGTGKTILATQIAVSSREPESARTLYLSFELGRESFESNFESFNWKRSDQVSFAELSADEFIGDVSELNSPFLRMIVEKQVNCLVIDSLTPLRLSFTDRSERSYREFLESLFKRLRDLKIVALVITESQPSRQLGETGAGPEHFLADTIITLRKEPNRRCIQRSLEVAKSRGQSVLLGRHAIKISDQSGVSVFPRAYARDRHLLPKKASGERILFGIPGLEQMMGGGLFRGSATLIVGISGTGKTISAMHFLQEGLSKGETCLMVSLDDSKDQFVRNSKQLGFDFSAAIEDGRLVVLNESPLELELDAHFCAIEACIERQKPSRVVIDSLATYEMILPDESHEFMLALSALIRSAGATSLFAYECPELLGISQISGKLKASAIADNIILLNYVEISTMLRRALTVPKTRGSSPDQHTREYMIKPGGIVLLDEASVPAEDRVPQLPLSCYYGVLARSPTRHSPIIDESVVAGKPMPKSKIPKPMKRAPKSSARPPLS